MSSGEESCDPIQWLWQQQQRQCLWVSAGVRHEDGGWYVWLPWRLYDSNTQRHM